MVFNEQRTVGLAIFAALMLTTSSAAIGQGVEMSAFVQQGVTSDSNPGLDTSGAESEVYTTTSFGMNISQSTGGSTLSFDANADWVIGRDDDDRNGFSSPEVRLAYAQETVNGDFDLDGFLVETDVDALDFVSGSSGVGLIAVDGTGTQRRTGAGLGYSIGKNARFGAGFTLDYVKTDYSDTTDPSLLDSTRKSVGIDFRFDINELTIADFGIDLAKYEEDGSAEEDINTYSLGVTRVLQNGDLGLNLRLTDVDGGKRKSLSLSRTLELGASELAVSVGAVDPQNGSTSAIGNLSWRHDLPAGRINFAIARSVSGDQSEDETELTTLSLSYLHEINDRWNARLFAGMSDSLDTFSNESSDTKNISLDFDYALNQDWDLRFGAKHRRKTDTTGAEADSNSFTFSIRRTFDLSR